MDVTRHGLERIQSRTRMVTSDVLSIIAHNAVVVLGAQNGFEFLLFYSPPDLRTKIAVVTHNRSHLISIWESHFALPPGIARANTKRNRKAKDLLRAYQFQLIKDNLKPRKYRMRIQILVRGKIMSEHESIEIAPTGTLDQLQSYLPPLKPNLMPLVEESGRTFRQVQYLEFGFLFLDAATGLARHRFVIKHKRLKLFLEYGS